MCLRDACACERQIAILELRAVACQVLPDVLLVALIALHLALALLNVGLGVLLLHPLRFVAQVVAAFLANLATGSRPSLL